MSTVNTRILDILDIKTAIKEIEKINRDTTKLNMFTEKSLYKAVKILDLSVRAANLLREEALIIGAEAIVSPDVAMFNTTKSDVLILATLYQYKLLCYNLQTKEFGLDRVGESIKQTLHRYNNEYPIFKKGNYSFDFNKNKYIMGILNITPDSFFDGGKYNNVDLAIKRAIEMKNEGADIIDIGAESTRRGAKILTEQEELDRVVPIIERLNKEVDIAISIDTYKSSVAEEALKNGAIIVNDITGLKGDKKIAEVISDHDAIAIIMHIKGDVSSMHETKEYNDLIEDICIDFKNSINIAEIAGIRNSNIIIDPGIGFSKTLSQNYEIINKLKELKSLGYPILVGGSRKSFIGKILNEEVEDRLIGSLAVAAIAIKNGASILRVHDVKETKKVIKILDTIENGVK